MGLLNVCWMRRLEYDILSETTHGKEIGGCQLFCVTLFFNIKSILRLWIVFLISGR